MSDDLPGDNTPSLDVNAESSPAPEAEAQPEGQVEASSTETPIESKKPNKVQERINQLTREKHEARQKNADLEKRLADLESKPKHVEEVKLAAPKEDDFENYSDFEDARSDYIAERASKAAYDRISNENKASEEKNREAERQRSIGETQAAFNQNLDSKREHFEDYDEVAFGHEFMDLELGLQIAVLDKGPEIAYHLGSHLDTAEKIFNMTPIQQARELAILEFNLETVVPKKVSDAPDPITPLGNSEAVQSDPDKMDADQWREWRNKQVYG